jgi:hypothetical protein
MAPTAIAIATLGSFIVLSSVGGCKDRDITVLEIKNVTPNTLTGVTVRDSRREWRIGSIEARGVGKFSGVLYGEGEASVGWTEDGRRYTAGLCYYSTRFPATGRIFIGNGIATVDCYNKVNRRLL